MVSRTKSLNRSAHLERRYVSRATPKEPERPSVDGLRHGGHPRLAGEAGPRRSPWHVFVQLEPDAASARQGLLVYIDPQTEEPLGYQWGRLVKPGTPVLRRRSCAFGQSRSARHRPPMSGIRDRRQWKPKPDRPPPVFTGPSTDLHERQFMAGP